MADAASYDDKIERIRAEIDALEMRANAQIRDLWHRPYTEAAAKFGAVRADYQKRRAALRRALADLEKKNAKVASAQEPQR